MATPTLAVEKCPTEEYSLRNRSVVHEKTAPYAKVTIAGRLEECYLTLDSDVKTAPGKLGLSAYQVCHIPLRRHIVWCCVLCAERVVESSFEGPCPGDPMHYPTPTTSRWHHLYRD